MASSKPCSSRKRKQNATHDVNLTRKRGAVGGSCCGSPTSTTCRRLRPHLELQSDGDTTWSIQSIYHGSECTSWLFLRSTAPRKLTSSKWACYADFNAATQSTLGGIFKRPLVVGKAFSLPTDGTGKAGSTRRALWPAQPARDQLGQKPCGSYAADSCWTP